MTIERVGKNGRTVKVEFDSEAELTEYLDIFFPERECSEVPGCYDVGGGQQIQVRERALWFPYRIIDLMKGGAS